MPFVLLRQGEEPRGIIGNGVVEQGSFEDEHWDPDKAAQGGTTMHVRRSASCSPTASASCWGAAGWAEETLTENLNFINRALSEGASRGYVNPREQTMEGGLVGAFWSYHKKLYSVPYYGKKPIYWLFASPEGHFQVLVYMHRMNKYTVQQVRQNYLHTWQQHLRGQIDELEGRARRPCRTRRPRALRRCATRLAARARTTRS